MTTAAKITDRTAPPKESFSHEAAAHVHRNQPATHPQFNHDHRAMTAHNGTEGMKNFDHPGNTFSVAGTEGGEPGAKGKTGTQTIAQNTETTASVSGSHTYRNPDANQRGFSTVGNDQLKTVHYKADGTTTTNSTETTQLASNEPSAIKPITPAIRQPHESELPEKRNQATA